MLPKQTLDLNKINFGELFLVLMFGHSFICVQSILRTYVCVGIYHKQNISAIRIRE